MTILITGASSGFGRETALKYARELDDMELVLLARRESRLLELKEEICSISKNISVRLLPLDVRDFESIRSCCLDLAVDILVNNAGLALGKESAHLANFGDWEKMIDINVKSLSFMSHLVLPGMVERGHGHIINVGSIAGTYPYPGSNVYGASKAFVKQFSKNLRSDLYDKNVRVTSIEPGLCDGSDFSFVRFHGDAEKSESVYRGTTPLHAVDIANVIFWVSMLPSHINVNSIELMPTTQACADLNISRREGGQFST